MANDIEKWMDNPLGGGGKKEYVASNAVTAKEYLDFLTAGQNLTSLAPGSKAPTLQGRTGVGYDKGSSFDKIRAGANQKLDSKVSTGLYADGKKELMQTDIIGLSGGAGDQVSLLASLYEKRLNDIMTRRARPGFGQVQ